MTRPVMVFEWCHNPEKTNFFKQEMSAGNFHGFGLQVLESDTGCASYSSAIVEMPDGTVMNVDVDLIRFDD